MGKILEGTPLASIPEREPFFGLYSVVQSDSGRTFIGNLEDAVEEFCGISATYPYTLDGQVHDDYWDHEHSFEGLLRVVLDNPAHHRRACRSCEFLH